jgi:DNA polymerase III subunit alpha
MTQAKTDFVHLHVHTEYSMLDGLNKLAPLVKKAKELGQTALAITDHGGMYGCLHFYNACKKEGIKPIIGLEAYMAKNSRHDKQTKMGSDQFHITLLAQNETGYKNLMRLTSLANLEGFSYKPRIDWEILDKYNEGIIATSGCMSSIFNRLLMKDKDDEALEWFKKFQGTFGDRFYIELQRHANIPEQVDLNKKLIAIARQLKIELIATNDVHYLNSDDAEAQDALICVQTRKLISDTKRMSMINSPGFYLKSSQEMAEIWHDYPEAIENTVKIAERCNLEIQTGNLIFPKFPLPEGETENSYFEKLSREGLAKKFKKPSAELAETLEKRLVYEMEIIINKGYAAYFLITQDFVRWSKSQGIAVGPGRGSAAGSLVSFCLDITSINPIEHGLPFERFLNPERPTPPDIDLDFADTRRDEVIRYVRDKYGHDHVGHVITFGRMEARVSIRDIGRVLGLPYEDPDKIAKLIPNDPGKKTSLEEAVQTVPELAEYYKQAKFKKLIDLAKKVEGVIRHSSVHAAAVIIADKALDNYTAIQRDSKSGKTITQYDMYALDCNVDEHAIGLLKFDFLGLRNLTIIQKALQFIKEQKDIEIDIETIPIDDKKTYELLSRGETMGVFQLESAGMRRVAKNLQPSQFSDITAMVALYRPGPMDLIPQFIEGKHNPETIHYPDDSLKPVLEQTYGIMVYQEQVMEIVSLMAGYSLGEADVIRRAIGKKKMKILAENKKRFIQESAKNGYKTEVSEKVWGFIEAFANYGFNKAHAASYAMIAYQTAYLKANYPVEYMAALLGVEAGSHGTNRDEKVAYGIETAKEMGIIILPPHINQSYPEFTIEEDTTSLNGQAIRFGFDGIKNVGSAALENIIETRQRVKKETGEGFQSLTQFLHETEGRKVNKKVLESLIKVGAMDKFGTRASMLENLDSIRQTASQFESEVEGQDNLFADVKQTTSVQDTFAELPEYPRPELLSFEKELLGLYLTEHPMANELKIVAKKSNKKVNEIDLSIHEGQEFKFGGILSKIRQVTTKKSGKLMAFANLEDDTGSLDLVFFPKTYEEYQAHIVDDSVVLVSGSVDSRDGEANLLVNKITPASSFDVNHIANGMSHEIFIPRKTNKETLDKIGSLLKKNPGSDQVLILIPNGGEPKKMKLPYGVAWSEALKRKIDSLLA